MGDHTAGLDTASAHARTPAFLDLVARTRDVIAETLAGFRRPMVAFSGGKDATVVLDLVAGVLPDVDAYSDNAFMYERARLDAQRLASDRCWSVTFGQHRSWEWLARHPRYVFSESTPDRAGFFSLNHQAGIRAHAGRLSADVVVFGRRHQENAIRSPLYDLAGRAQFHPIHSWSTADVWAYLRMRDFPVPWLYTTHHGRWIGYNPFTSVRPSILPPGATCWSFVDEHDPLIRPTWEQAVSAASTA